MNRPLTGTAERVIDRMDNQNVQGGDPGQGGGPGQPAIDAAQLAQIAMAAANLQAQALQPTQAELQAFPLDPVTDTLGKALHTCSITDRNLQYSLCTKEGLDTVQKYCHLPLTTVKDLTDAMSRRTKSATRLSSLQENNLRAFIWWITDLADRGQPVNVNFELADLQTARGELRAYESRQRMTHTPEPPKMYPGAGNWVPWWESVKNYLQSTMGVRNRSLSML